MQQNITIVGAGLVGCLLGVMLSKRGYTVRIIERRPDMRTTDISAGRSINLALSERGLRALEIAGIADDIRAIAIPMKGRVMHDVAGNHTFLPYGVGDQAINSVSRGTLNATLMTVAERHGVEILFNRRCIDVDMEAPSATFEDTLTGEHHMESCNVLFGADGAFSAVRDRLIRTDRVDYSQSFLAHGYKELHIPPAADGAFAMEKHALHIWPRHSYMMIALPNLDGSFTCTLFFAHEGSPSFQELRREDQIQRFFEEQFPDAMALMPTLVEDFMANPESALVTVKCSPWTYKGRVALIGDAAHAIVPFYGQGMNCGFEDCRVLMDCLEATLDSWDEALPLYESFRKPAGNAIADLALDNFIEMRDKVADPVFLMRKKIEAWLHATYPSKWIPLYTMVTFEHQVPYNEAQRAGREQDAIMQEMFSHSEVMEDWTTERSKAILHDIIMRRPDVVFAADSPTSAER